MKKKILIQTVWIIFLSLPFPFYCKQSFAFQTETVLADQTQWQNTPLTLKSPDASSVAGSDDDLDQFDEYDEEPALVADPFKVWNKAMFYFNDKLILWILEPVAKGYRAVLPLSVRKGVKNVFNNFTTPVRFVNSMLQGKGGKAELEVARFLVNSTMGVLGFLDPAAKYPNLAAPTEEDLGQTLGVYGIGHGFFIIWPFVGPSTLRDSIGILGDSFIDPTSYIDPAEAALEINGVKTINRFSFHIGDYESLKAAAIDPYQSFRDVYIQIREKKTKQ